MITGYELIEKMYSENYDEYEDTRLYSTGDDELDDLLERAFCDGYEYAQREYSLKDDIKKAIKNNDKKELERLEKKATKKGRRIGAGSGAVVGGLGTGIPMSKFMNKNRDEIRRDTEDKLKLGPIDDSTFDLGLAISKGILSVPGAGVGAGIGTGAGHLIGKARFNRALKKAKKELENEK